MRHACISEGGFVRPISSSSSPPWCAPDKFFYPAPRTCAPALLPPPLPLPLSFHPLPLPVSPPLHPSHPIGVDEVQTGWVPPTRHQNCPTRHQYKHRASVQTQGISSNTGHQYKIFAGRCGQSRQCPTTHPWALLLLVHRLCCHGPGSRGRGEGLARLSRQPVWLGTLLVLLLLHPRKLCRVGSGHLVHAAQRTVHRVLSVLRGTRARTRAKTNVPPRCTNLCSPCKAHMYACTSPSTHVPQCRAGLTIQQGLHGHAYPRIGWPHMNRTIGH